MGKPSTQPVYKCSKCHKTGHNVRRCGEAHTTQKKKPPTATKPVKRTLGGVKSEPASVKQAYDNLHVRRNTQLPLRSNVFGAVERYLSLIGIWGEKRENFNIIEVRSAKFDNVPYDGEQKERRKLLSYIDMEGQHHEFEGTQNHSPTPLQVGSANSGEGQNFVLLLRNKKDNHYAIATLNKDGYLHSFNGNPALIEHPGTGDELREWLKEGQLHNLHSPAVTQGGDGNWWVEGQLSMQNFLCKKATSQFTTENELFQLCQNDDFVVRQLAAANPNSPKEWAVVAELYSDKNTPSLPAL